MAETISDVTQPLSGDNAKTKFEEFCKKKHFIFPSYKKVKEQDGSFSDVSCGYSCEACGCRIFSKAKLDSHIGSKSHGLNRKHYKKFKFIKDVPAPSPEHESQLCAVLNSVWETHGMVERDMQTREGIRSWFQEAVEKESLDCDVRLIGSSKYGAGLRSSPVDVDLSLNGEKFNTPQVLLKVLELLKDSGRFSDVDPDFASKRPTIYCTESESGLRVNITAGSSFIWRTASLLRIYCDIDHRVRVLGTAFRYWSYICQLDDSETAGFTSYVCLLMVVHFLQHVKPPVLPVLRIDKDCEGHGGGKDGDKEVLERVEKVEEVLPQAQEWKSRNMDTIAKLWLGFFRFYLLDFKREDFVINVRSRAKIAREDKNWNRRRLAIEDPFARKYRVGDPLQSNDVFNYIMDVMGRSFRYFTGPCNENSNVSADSFKFECDALTDKRKRPIELTRRKDTTDKKKQGEVKRCAALPPLTDPFEKMLSSVCFAVWHHLAITQNKEEQRKAVVRELERNLQQFFPGCRLHLFGSSVNAFGMKKSDLDICMLLNDSWTPPAGFRQDEQIRALGKRLTSLPNVTKVMTIATAKVPICKFVVVSLALEADISFYNVLAQRNSSLLRTYALVDERVRPLGFMIKYFAKVCDIGDASKGSLSSYAYIIMLLHYLQNCNPPVVPVLQDLYEGSEKPKELVDDWDCWFYNDLKNLKSLWPGLGQNNESVGRLLVGFFRYYVETFNFFENVVSIRQDRHLTKFEKMWNGSFIAIEDPFNLSHNLGRGVSESMFDFISSSFSRGRERFGTSYEGPFFYDPLEYFFDKSFLIGNKSMPTDRLCRICGHVGHRANACERRLLSDVATFKSKLGKKGKGSTGKQGKRITQKELDDLKDLMTVRSPQGKAAVSAVSSQGKLSTPAVQTPTTDAVVTFRKISTDHEDLPNTNTASDEMGIHSYLEQLAIAAAELSMAEDDDIVSGPQSPNVVSPSKNPQSNSKDSLDTSDVLPVALPLSALRPTEYGAESNKRKAASSELGLLSPHNSVQSLGVDLLPSEVAGMPASPLCPIVSSSSLPSRDLPTGAAQSDKVLTWQAEQATSRLLSSVDTVQGAVPLKNLSELTYGSPFSLNSPERSNSSALRMSSDVKPPLHNMWPFNRDFSDIQGCHSPSMNNDIDPQNSATTSGGNSCLQNDRNPFVKTIYATTPPALSELDNYAYNSLALQPEKESKTLEESIQDPANEHFSSSSRQRRAFDTRASTIQSIGQEHSTGLNPESPDHVDPTSSQDKKPKGMSFDEFLQKFKEASPGGFSSQRGAMVDISDQSMLSKLEGADDTQCRRSLSFGDFEDHLVHETFDMDSLDTRIIPDVRSKHSTGDLQVYKDQSRGRGDQTSTSEEQIFPTNYGLEASHIFSKGRGSHKPRGKRQYSSGSGGRSRSISRGRPGIYQPGSHGRRDAKLSSPDDEVLNSGLNSHPPRYIRHGARDGGRRVGGRGTQKRCANV